MINFIYSVLFILESIQGLLSEMKNHRVIGMIKNWARFLLSEKERSVVSINHIMTNDDLREVCDDVKKARRVIGDATIYTLLDDSEEVDAHALNKAILKKWIV